MIIELTGGKPNETIQPQTNELIGALPTTAERLLDKPITDYQSLRLAGAAIYPFASHNAETGVTSYTALIDYELYGDRLKQYLESVAPVPGQTIGQMMDDWGRLAGEWTPLPEFYHFSLFDKQEKARLRTLHSHYLKGGWDQFMNYHVGPFLEAIQVKRKFIEGGFAHLIGSVASPSSKIWNDESGLIEKLSASGVTGVHLEHMPYEDIVEFIYKDRLKGRIHRTHMRDGSMEYKTGKVESTFPIIPVLQWETDSQRNRRINVSQIEDPRIITFGLDQLAKNRTKFSEELQSGKKQLSSLAGLILLGYCDEIIRRNPYWAQYVQFHEEGAMMEVNNAQVPVRFIESSVKPKFTNHPLLIATEKYLAREPHTSERLQSRYLIPRNRVSQKIADIEWRVRDRIN